MTGIEFRSEDPGDAEAEELLDSGPRRHVPRWLVVCAVLVLGAGAVYATLQRSVPTATPRRSSSSAPLPPVRVQPDDNLGDPLALPGSVLDVAVSDGRAWVLQPAQLTEVLGGDRTVAVPAPRLDPGFAATVRLVVDPSARRLWVVVQGAAYGRVLEYDTRLFRLLHDFRTLPHLDGAAALSGHLYLASATRLVDAAPDGTLHNVGRLPIKPAELIADPSRGRLLLADGAQRTRIWTVTPRHGGAARVSAPVRIAATRVSFAVVSGAIWLAGFDTGDGVLMRLDPTSLRPVAHSVLDPILEPGAAIVAGGWSVFWVRDGGGAPELRCIDATSGRQLQTWVLPGQVSSWQGAALVSASYGVVPLTLAACPG